MSRRILVVDDDASLRVAFEFHLTRSGYEVAAASSAEEALGVIHQFGPDVVITDIQMEGMSGLELLNRVGESLPEVDVVVITGYEDMRSAIGAIRDGAYDYLVKPVDVDQLDMVLQRCFRDRSARRRLGDDTVAGGAADRTDILVGRSPRMIEIYKTIGMLAGTRAPVLIRGETGTGKELIARAIHYHSPQADEPFIAINCTAIAESLLESELFGHVRGSFTGAVADRRGRFELAGSGTIFLDEIGDTSPAFQAKLLRVLQEREFYPVGSERPRRTEARVIAATHRPIEELIAEGSFREDLYFRLRVVEIRLPPLRERREDIPLLAESLLAKAAREIHKDVRVIPAAVVKALQSYDWPGNVREMENAIMRAVVLAPGPAVSLEGLGLGTLQLQGAASEGKPEETTLDAVERAHVERILKQTGGNKRRAASLLGISRPRLDRILAKHDLAPPGTTA
ncbi:MAG TPA: sigma-54 dependent transcriptional regulator [Longimicrobiaceae bacterium]|nr:sigma-54 dependent transcriptional regulator [Longimicrobiaceae bacterium]